MSEQDFYQPSPPLRQPKLNKKVTKVADQKNENNHAEQVADVQAEENMSESFTQFLSNKKSKMSRKEIFLILSRNGLGLTSLYQDFLSHIRSDSMLCLKKQIDEKVNLSRSLLDDLTGILIEFFKSKSRHEDIGQGSEDYEHGLSFPTKVNDAKHFHLELRKIQACIAMKDFTKSKDLLMSVSGEVSYFVHKVKSTEAEMINLKNKRSFQSDNSQRLQVIQENFVLKSKNSSFLEETMNTNNKKKLLIKKMKLICEAINSFSDDIKFEGCVEELNNNDTETSMLEGLKKLQQFYIKHRGHQGKSIVNLVLDGQEKIRFSTNKNNNIGIFELERFLSRTVVSFQAPQLVGGEYREMERVKGYVNCPALGWGDREFRVITQPQEGSAMYSE